MRMRCAGRGQRRLFNNELKTSPFFDILPRPTARAVAQRVRLYCGDYRVFETHHTLPGPARTASNSDLQYIIVDFSEYLLFCGEAFHPDKKTLSTTMPGNVMRFGPIASEIMHPGIATNGNSVSYAHGARHDSRPEKRRNTKLPANKASSMVSTRLLHYWTALSA